MHEILTYFTLTEIQVERQHFRSEARDRAWRPTELPFLAAISLRPNMPLRVRVRVLARALAGVSS